ncbi:PIN-like domain-containing protein [Dehalobacter sp.]|uniref:PIN-like domain-containing protein n=1 Tax=Dehalobacter sp. TaxID=1962289 RepID=UPI0025846553|nr:PIN-like domain-containing protein [Dehalobacter sp.]MDJ0304853.1 PIN-like domain-containing protein [Dehalobacter sp.]
MSDFITLNAFKSIYASKPIYVFDTNIYLDLLRYSKFASTEMLDIYKTLHDDIRIPAQVLSEFAKNLSVVQGQRTSNAKKAITESRLCLNSCSESVLRQMNIFIKYKFLHSQEIADEVKTNLDKLKVAIDEYVLKNVLSSTTGFLEADSIESFIKAIYEVNPHSGFSQLELFDIYKDGHFRYKYKIPPGYMDDPRQNPDSRKDGVSVFGDLILWNEIIRLSTINNRPIVFVTSDVKEDWFILDNKRPIAPREELTKEFFERTDGKQICILPNDVFIKHMGLILNVKIKLALAEIQIDEFVDVAIRNNIKEIKQKMIEWLNADEHIYLLPFIVDINRLMDIDDLRMVFQDASVEVSDYVYYSVLLQGMAQFTGAFYNEGIERFTSNEIDSFVFDLKISFKRAYEKEDVKERAFSKEITDITIISGAFERVPEDKASLESKRGVFIKPNDTDAEIYQYMMSIWDYYEKKHSVDVAEALVFIDTAEHFDCSLLEINRSFTLVQNLSTKMNLSLNEIDALAIKRFKDVGILIQGNTGRFREIEVNIGEPYPIPDSMKVLPPEEGKAIPVYFKVISERLDNKYVQIKGETNLPESTHLMISLKNKDLHYNTQSKSDVMAGGHFVSEVFKNGKNTDNNALPLGSYELEIVVPIISVQPDSVKVAFGNRGRNLIGDYVSSDTIMGQTIRFTHQFDI